MNDRLPEWVRVARMKWEYTGQKRPAQASVPKKGQESVWDYPRPPAIKADTRVVSVSAESTVLTRSENALRVLETASPPTIYVPFKDVELSQFTVSDKTSMCEWKGIARHWAFDFNKQGVHICAWDYPDPFPEFSMLIDYMAFYPARLTCMINDELVLPQPGGVYGGWITKEIIGPFKGEPGTEDW